MRGTSGDRGTLEPDRGTTSGNWGTIESERDISGDGGTSEPEKGTSRHRNQTGELRIKKDSRTR